LKENHHLPTNTVDGRNPASPPGKKKTEEKCDFNYLDFFHQSCISWNVTSQQMFRLHDFLTSRYVRRSLPKKHLATWFPLECAAASTSSPRPRGAKAWSWNLESDGMNDLSRIT